MRRRKGRKGRRSRRRSGGRRGGIVSRVFGMVKNPWVIGFVAAAMIGLAAFAPSIFAKAGELGAKLKEKIGGA